MGRASFDPRDYGIDSDKAELTDRLVDQFNGTYRDHWTVDEIVTASTRGGFIL